MSGTKKKKRQAALVDELRERRGAARRRRLEKPRQEKAEAVEKWYEECRDEARKAADDDEREARVATGYPTDGSPGEYREILNEVAKKLRAVDKLRMRREVVKSDWISDDTGKPFTKRTLVLVITW